MTSDVIGGIPLFLTDEDARDTVWVPVQDPVGTVRLRNWQVHPIWPIPPGFAGRSAYLIQINFDLEFDTPLAWIEVAFQFVGDRVLVHDAIPGGLGHPEAARSYELTPTLSFAPLDGRPNGRWPLDSAAAQVALPAVGPAVECHGVGGSRVSWVFRDTVSRGRRTAWIVLGVPENESQVLVESSVRFALRRLVARRRPAARPDAFTVDLPPTPAASLRGPTLAFGRGGGSPRVFVSYAHESDEHKVKVERLCAFLDNVGVDVRFDQQDLHERREWGQWITAHVLQADFVIVVASRVYRDVSEGKLREDEHRGVQAEYRLLYELHYCHPTEWTRRILPVVLPGHTVYQIPLGLYPLTSTHYVVTEFNSEGAPDLMKVLDAARGKSPG